MRTERESNAPRSASPAATAAPGEALWPVPSGSEPPATFETELPLLTAHEELLLAQQVEAGDPHAREELITRNLRLVAHIARGYAGYARGALGLDDLIQEGRIGLIKAVDRFDPRRGCRFSTYATHWINQSDHSRGGDAEPHGADSATPGRWCAVPPAAIRSWFTSWAASPVTPSLPGRWAPAPRR